MVQFKQKCIQCKKNYVTVSSRNARAAVCFECQEGSLKGEVADPVLKAMLDIPEELYQQNAFLRSIKINAIKYGSLSERQIEAFKGAVEKLSKAPKAPAEPKIPSIEDIPMPTMDISMRAMRLAKAAKKKAKKEK